MREQLEKDLSLVCDRSARLQAEARAIGVMASGQREEWLTRIREATAGIDERLQTGAPPLTAFDLGEASQAAHRAIIALGEAG